MPDNAYRANREHLRPKKVTRDDVEKALDALCRTAGFPRYNPETRTGYVLDNYPVGGGYLIAELTGEGDRYPFGSKRRNAKDMHDVIWFAQEVAFQMGRRKEASR